MKIKLLNENAKLPTRHNETDAGLDLYSAEEVFIPVGENLVISTGIAISLPKGTFGKIEDRSSLASKGLKTAGGVIDEGYIGEIKIVMNNLTNKTLWHGGPEKYGYKVNIGDKIAQLIIIKYESPTIENVKEFNDSSINDKKRGLFGWGSSGR